ncbi:PQQ-like beta-propeller repeat protein [Yinghuangia sp. ASG 101]|uniref:outer membrane protein assembly factor BamB family protein n=1 Tax=Yinghuangia sp. ASG 101 TaxID=2896848 RepID=UPI001E426EAA|nr:PQQ-binding-like beta-propeller repeat protein [Yinghuangia sp. ASG 101]UGQ14920.1 PQQ-like beta-propeller repeat protein [Yinghuangia sp. ASG 101]
MTNPPPPFRVPGDNEPDDNGQQQGQYGPPQGDPQAFTPPYGMPAPHNPQQPPPVQQQGWSPPQDQQWQPPQQDQQWQPGPSDQQQWQPPPQGQRWQPGPSDQQQWQPPQQDQQWAPPPPGPQQFGAPPAPPGGEQPPFVPPQSSAPRSSPVPQQSFGEPQSQPQWSSGGGVATPPAAFPPGGSTGFDSGPGGMPPSGPALGHRSGPGPGPGGFPPPGPPPTPSAPPVRPQDRHLGPPRAHRPPGHKRSVLLPVALAALLVAGVSIPAAAKQAQKEVGGSSAGDPLAKAEVIWSIREGRDGPATPVAKIGEEKLSRTGVWYTDKTVVIAEARRLAAYNLDTGAQAWEYTSSDGEFVCNVDVQSDARQAIVAFGGADDCSTLEGIDIVAGKKMWSTSAKEEKSDSGVPDLGDFTKFNMSKPIVVSGGVAVFDDVAYQTSDGRKLWSTESALGEDCSTLSGGYSGGAKLVVMASCGGGFDSDSTVAELDPMTGKAKWTFDAPSGSFSDTVSVVSTDPVMIMKAPLLGMGDASPEITVLDDQGREAFKITDGYPVVAPRGSDVATDTVPVLATDTTIFVPGSDRSGSFGGILDGANLITAYDRATGRKLWTQNMAVGSKIFKLKSQGSIFPIRVEDSGDLLVLVQDGGATSLRPMSLIRVSAKDGSMTNLKELPKRVTVAKLALMRGALVHEQDGRVYLTGYPAGKDPALEDLPVKNVLGQAVHYDMSTYRVIAMQ